MQTSMKVTNPKEIDLTLTMTMSLGLWAELDDQLSDAWPASRLSTTIHSMLMQVNKQYIPEDE